MLPPSVRIFLCTVPQDMRRSFDTLGRVVRELMGQDPMNGSLFVFVGRRPVRVKVLWWDWNGYRLLYKRLHRSLFRLPPDLPFSPAVQIDGRALAELLAGLETREKVLFALDITVRVLTLPVCRTPLP